MDKLHEEKLRAEFEKQIREDLLFDDEELEWQRERNCYAIYCVHLAWWGYRASRVNLVVELPELSGNQHFIGDMRSSKAAAFKRKKARDAVINECAESLRSIGLSIKVKFTCNG